MLLFGYCHKDEDQTLFQTRIYSIGEAKWFPFKEMTFIYLCVCMCLLAHACVSCCVCGGQSAVSRNQFSFSTVWVPGIKSKTPGVASAFTQWAISPPTNMVLYDKHPNRLTPLTHYSRSHVPSPKSAIAVVTRISKHLTVALCYK